MTTLTDQIEKIKRASEAAWDTCVDTATDEDAADEARDEGIECYETAIDAIERSDYAAAKAALETAQTLEREWGDDSFARRALELLESTPTTYEQYWKTAIGDYDAATAVQMFDLVTGSLRSFDEWLDEAESVAGLVHADYREYHDRAAAELHDAANAK